MASPPPIYFWLGLVFLLGFVFLTPPFQVADEHVHFLRAYHLTTGTLKATKLDDTQVGAPLPRSIRLAIEDLLIPVMHKPEAKVQSEVIFDHLGRPLSPGDKIFQNFHNTALYPPPAYLPQMAAIGLGRIFGLSALAQFYLARLAAMAVSWWLTYLAIRKIPAGKWTLLAVALMPMTLFQTASSSADALIMAYSLFFLAVVIHLATKPVELSLRGLGLLFLLTVCVSLGKTAYLPLPLLLLMVPANRFPPLHNPRLALTAVMITAILLPFLWTLWVRDIYIQGRRDPTRDIHPDRQLTWVLEHPIEFFGVLGETIQTQFGFYRDSLIGYLGWLDTPLPKWSVFTYILALILAVILDRERRAPAFPHGVYWILASVLGSNCLLIFLMLYLSWTDVGGPLIEGIQGRYFIPLLPLFLLLFSTLPTVCPPRWRPTLALLFLTLVMVVYLSSWFAVLNRYYG